jgi:hypothetical protein
MIRPSKSGGVRLLAGSSQTGHGMDGIERSILYYNRHGSDEPSAPRPKPSSAWPPARAAGRSLRQWPSITRRLRGWQGRTAPRVRGRTDAVISTAAPLSGLSRRGGQARERHRLGLSREDLMVGVDQLDLHFVLARR